MQPKNTPNEEKKSCSEGSSDFLSRHNTALLSARAIAVLLTLAETAGAADFESRRHSELEILLTKLSSA